ncbi:MAG: YIP1 family protein [Oscillospiraceae bacterium]
MKKKLVIMLLCALIFCSGLTLSVSAESPYQSYTYSYTGKYQISPDAFVPKIALQNIEGTEPLKNPTDIVSDEKGQLYISDTGNNRVVILNPDYTLKKVLSFYQKDGQDFSFNQPTGLFVGVDGGLFVADTNNGNIVEFDNAHEFKGIVPAPQAQLLPDDFDYKPTAVAVDKQHRFYVISSGTNMGVITFQSDGVFQGFIGAQKVKVSPATMFWRMFMSEVQLSKINDVVPITFNNIAMDKKGFVYVTTASIDAFTLQKSINERSRDDSYSPIKKLNPAGNDVLNRNGFFPPVGDLVFDAYSGKGKKKPSALTEIAVLDNNTYSVVDSAYNKIFTYDEYGNLLYVFGGTGTQDGLFTTLASVCYQGNNLIALDSASGRVTVFEKTKYGLLIDEAIALQQDRKFSETINVWQEIEKYNNNYDLAYVGIGKSLHEQGEYEQAMEYFKAVSNKELYSKSMEKQRMLHLKNVAIFILILIIALIWLIIKFFKYANKFNKTHGQSIQKRTLKEELLYGFRVIFHPFNGFWELKNEKRGGIRGACIFLALATFAMVAKDFLSGYLMMDLENLDKITITGSIINFLLPVFLWCIANWCLTSLMDGKGNFKDIFVATSYALIPIILLVLPASLISNFLVQQELAFITYALNLALFWTGLLIFFGSMVTHSYELGKNIGVCILTIVGIAIILFLAFLLLNVSSRMFAFISNIITEISFRV